MSVTAGPAQYIARLASAAHIEGIDLATAEALRVN
jgi:hypothetical protein